MGNYVLIHTWSDSNEGCELAGQEMSRSMEKTEKQGILEHMCWHAEVHGLTRLLKISTLKVQSRGHLHPVLTNGPVQD